MLLPSGSKKEKVIKKKTAIVDSSSSDEEEVDTKFSLASSSSLNLSEEEKSENITSANLRSFEGSLPEKDDFVAIEYDGDYWPGHVENCGDGQNRRIAYFMPKTKKVFHKCSKTSFNKTSCFQCPALSLLN
ncbi:unnamed protein product [Acanthoscelides obtectus]|uniref:Uncharacterized protein n=1 Tax=Acanthoscelides obtectus TaxID=200917 RepID=A0A9P0Q5L6_ACAOB|nr:unnamed protein product [Acanthoscelides obtectus]CAK1623987.1 hypothetical protein AOBTE_LOCUS2268 [Acanthoscelides obtectus]